MDIDLAGLPSGYGSVYVVIQVELHLETVLLVVLGHLVRAESTVEILAASVPAPSHDSDVDDAVVLPAFLGLGKAGLAGFG